MKRALWLVGIALVLFLAYGIYDAGRDEKGPPPSNSSIVFEQGHANGHRLRFKSWTADYDKIVSNADQTILDLDGIHNGIIFKKGKPYLRVRAAHMSVNTLSRDFSARGPFHAESIDTTPQRSFDTDDAMWNDATQTLVFPRRAVVHSGADAPLVIGSLTLDVKTGELALRDVAGPLRLK